MAVTYYWLGQPDNRDAPIIYSSVSGSVVSETDAGYVAWLAANGKPIPWPRDATGAVTAAALDALLMEKGLAPTGLTPQTQENLFAYAWGKVSALLSVDRAYPMTGVASLDGATSIVVAIGTSQANLDSLALWAASAAPTDTEDWTDDAYRVWPLTPANALAFTGAVTSYGKSVYAMLAAATTAIRAATITTTAQIDALSWPT